MTDHEIEKITGGILRPANPEEKRIARLMGRNTIAYVVDWQLRTVKKLLVRA